MTINEQISNEFRSRFEQYRETTNDIASALEDARNDASALVPEGVTGTFDDETLTFVADEEITQS